MPAVTETGARDAAAVVCDVFETSGSMMFTANVPRASPASSAYSPGVRTVVTCWPDSGEQRQRGSRGPVTRVTDGANAARPGCCTSVIGGRASQSSASPINTGNAGADARLESFGPNARTTTRGLPGRVTDQDERCPGGRRRQRRQLRRLVDARAIDGEGQRIHAVEQRMRRRRRPLRLLFEPVGRRTQP